VVAEVPEVPGVSVDIVAHTVQNRMMPVAVDLAVMEAAEAMVAMAAAEEVVLPSG
jgi:hypothetical protein